MPVQEESHLRDFSSPTCILSTSGLFGMFYWCLSAIYKYSAQQQSKHCKFKIRYLSIYFSGHILINKNNTRYRKRGHNSWACTTPMFSYTDAGRRLYDNFMSPRKRKFLKIIRCPGGVFGHPYFSPKLIIFSVRKHTVLSRVITVLQRSLLEPCVCTGFPMGWKKLSPNFLLNFFFVFTHLTLGDFMYT